MIQASGLTKYFGGKRALGPVSFTINSGEMVGFLGVNGAGKTTLLRILAGDLRPSAGTLVVNGSDAVREPLAVRRLVGFLPELPPLYPDMAVGDYLRFAGQVRGMEGDVLERRLAEVEELTGLVPVHEELTRNLSQGFRQRVGLAQAIIHEPALLVLDEPTHDLDPAQIVEMRGLVRTLRGHHTILVSSHNLPEISETCDRLLVLDSGQVIATGTEAELSARWVDAQRVEVEIRSPQSAAESAMEALRGIEGIREVTPAQLGEGYVVLVVDSTDDRRADICRTLVGSGFDVVRLERSRRKLESVFLELIHGAERTRDSGHSVA